MRVDGLWLLGTLGGLGRAPLMPGTVASVFAAVLWWVLFTGTDWLAVMAVLVAATGGIVVCGRLAQRLGEADPQQIVLDELAGTWLALLLAPVGGYWQPAALLLFRAADILKPWPVSAFERLPGGLGIMADDLAAGLLAAAACWGLHIALA